MFDERGRTRISMGMLVTTALAISPGLQAAAAPAPDGVVALNEEVLQLWQQEAGGGGSPELVRDSDGSSRLRWRGAISTDYYHNNSRGGFTLTPNRGENANYSVQLQTEGRAHWTEDDTSWLMFGGTASDDRAQLDSPAMINTLQFGHAGENYRITLGDLAVNSSRLGASIGLRGLQGERLFGNTYVQALAGVQSETWESLSKRDRRTRYLRDAYAIKLQHPVTEALAVYLTNQGYSDDKDSTVADLTALAPSDGNATTAGFSFQHDRFNLSGEAGFSNWKEKGLNDENDSAWLLDAGWQGDRLSVQLGHHDIGTYYSSLSGDTLSGVRDSYGSASWLATDWLSFNGDVRRTINKRALAPKKTEPPLTPPYTPNAYSANSWTLGSNIAILPVPGLNLQLQQSQSAGHNEDGGTNDLDDSLLNLQYNIGAWTTGFGYQRSEIENSAAAAANSVTRGWNYLLGRQWSEPSNGDWTIDAQAMYRDQRQSLDAGGHTGNKNYQLSVNAQHILWGQLGLSWFDGRVQDTATGQSLDQWQLLVEAGRSIGRYGAVKLYLSKSDSFDDKADIAYEEKVVGLRFTANFGADNLDQ